MVLAFPFKDKNQGNSTTTANDRNALPTVVDGQHTRCTSYREATTTDTTESQQRTIMKSLNDRQDLHQYLDLSA